jgi:Uma2 family endonuclease
MSVDPAPLTLADFIAWEERQPTKHEFRAGAVYAMAGATDDHNTIVANLIAIVRPTLRGSACRTYANDMKVATSYPGSRYPDFLVTCDPRDARDALTKRYPKLIVEVLSQSTAEIDATDKLDEYQTILELEEYVLIDSRKRSIRIYRRNGNDLSTGPAVISGNVSLRSLGEMVISLDDIYEDVDFDRTKNPNSVGS